MSVTSDSKDMNVAEGATPVRFSWTEVVASIFSGTALFAGIPVTVALALKSAYPVAAVVVLVCWYVLLCTVLIGVRAVKDDDLLAKWRNGGLDEELGYTVATMVSLVLVFGAICRLADFRFGPLYVIHTGFGTCLLYAADQAVNALLLGIPGFCQLHISPLRPDAMMAWGLEIAFFLSFDAYVIVNLIRLWRFIVARRVLDR